MLISQAGPIPASAMATTDGTIIRQTDRTSGSQTDSVMYSSFIVLLDWPKIWSKAELVNETSRVRFPVAEVGFK